MYHGGYISAFSEPLRPRSWKKSRFLATEIRFKPALILILWCAAALAGNVDPCALPSHRIIDQANRISKPALGNIDELPVRADKLDPRIPISQRYTPIDNPLYHGDQCRAVLGPIPHFNCADGYLVPIHHDGKIIRYRDGVLSEDGSPANPDVLNQCDDPALLPYLFVNPKRPGGRGKKATEGCLPNVRVGHVKSGNVDWVYLCHWHSGLHEQDAPYDFVTVIGTNSITGETCFFGHDQGKTAGVSLPAPGGDSLDDVKGRKSAAEFWNVPSHNTCLRCHSSNQAWTLTPHLNQSRLGGDGTMDFLPEVARSKRMTPGWGFRVIGTVHNLVMPHPKAIWPKNDDGSIDRTCVRCHLVSDREEFLRLSRDAVGLPDLPKYAERSVSIPRSKRPWMPLDHLGQWDGIEKYQQAVERLERAVYDPKFRANEADILSPCPVPVELDRRTVRVETTSNGQTAAWTYRNDYGEVPTRDDVRFEVGVEGSDGSRCSFRDVAPQELGSDQWRFELPTREGVHYTVRLRPYRYCFDRTAYRYGNSVSVSAK